MKIAQIVGVKFCIKQAKIRTKQAKIRTNLQKFANFLPQIQTKSLTFLIVSREFGVVKWVGEKFFLH
jgi:hypothetical protein